MKPTDIAARVSGRNLNFIWLILLTIGVALVLVAASMALYVSSGAEQLDLSRPGYAEIRDQAAREANDFEGFDNSGELDAAALERFERLYGEQIEEVESFDAFGGDVLSPQSLQIDQQSAEAQAEE